jgi:hypothetical protein
MTPNRARKTDTVKLLAEENIPHREAAYLSSHRKLRLADGTIHDFATGPVRYLGLPNSGQGHATMEALKEARSKGWIVTRAISGPILRSAMADTRPGLIILQTMKEVGTTPDPLTEEIEAGLHRNLNILILREPKPGEHLKDPVAGRNIHLRADEPELDDPAPAPHFNNLALTRARIAFALRFADMLATGTDEASALGSVAKDMDRIGTLEAAAVAAAARATIPELRSGSTLAHELHASEDLFGAHLVEVVDSAAYIARLISGLRNAAATLEADLRIGLIT